MHSAIFLSPFSAVLLSIQGTKLNRPGIRGVVPLPAGEIEQAVLQQIQATLQKPEMIIAVWRAAQTYQAEQPDQLDEAQAVVAMRQMEQVWEQLFPVVPASSTKSNLYRALRTRLSGAAACFPRCSAKARGFGLRQAQTVLKDCLCPVSALRARAVRTCAPSVLTVVTPCQRTASPPTRARPW